ncbi:MAG: ATP-binding protein [Eubacteriales bacterium]|nr:ATP-binding protein [Eubacteriales bacterium]
MKRKIYWNMCMVALFSMVLATLFSTWLLCRDMQTQMKQAVITEVRYLESAMETGGKDFLDHLASKGDGNSINRITWVDTDGEVLYDSYAASGELENHGDRPEIRQALQTGAGHSTRLSDTLAEQTYYYAARLHDGSVIRVASTMRSGLASMVNTIPLMILMAAVIFGVTMGIADRQTRRIVEPINRLNPDEPQAEKVYDELSPLVRRLEKQKETIRQQMETLREKQEEFTAITENMREGFIVVDSRADVISYNGSAARILGVDMEKTGDASINVLSFNRSSSFRQVVDAALQGERGEQNLELNGRYYQIIANPVVESWDKRGAVVVILDVTEQQDREELRREFTANVSHELKTPLTSISGYAEIMKNGLVQPKDMARFSEKIYNEAQRLITLVGDIIKLSRLDEEQVEVEKTAVDLHLVASNVAGRLRDVAAKSQVSLALKGGPLVVQGNQQILDEMLFNLCDNAIKYNKPKGYVVVTTEMENGHPVLTVEDNGIGIPPEDRERIFERFYRVDKSHSKQIGGTGLGLSIVKHGAIYHKAKVELTSSLGKGTKVRIVF